MRLRDRNAQQRGSDGDGPAAAAGPDAQERARRLLDQADEAIRRALSSDSEHFLAQNRQQGGE